MNDPTSTPEHLRTAWPFVWGNYTSIDICACAPRDHEEAVSSPMLLPAPPWTAGSSPDADDHVSSVQIDVADPWIEASSREGPAAAATYRGWNREGVERGQRDGGSRYGSTRLRLRRYGCGISSNKAWAREAATWVQLAAHRSLLVGIVFIDRGASLWLRSFEVALSRAAAASWQLDDGEAAAATIIGNVMMSQLFGLAEDWSSISLKIAEAYEFSIWQVTILSDLFFFDI